MLPYHFSHAYDKTNTYDKLYKNAVGGHVTTYEYNSANQLIKSIKHGGRTGTTNNYTYEISKNVLKQLGY